MKKIQKIAIIFFIGIVAAFSAINYTYQQITPRILEDSTFPLKEKWHLCVDENITDISTNGNGIVFANTNATLNVYNENTGNLMWKSPINASFPPTVANERVFISDSEYLWAFELATGKTLWKTPLDSTNTWVPYASDKFVLLNSISNRVDVYDAKLGKKLWEADGDRGYTKAYIDKDKVYIIDNGIKVFDATTGSLLETVDDNSITDLSTFDNGVIYYTKYQGVDVYDGGGTYDLIAYNVRTKEKLWRIIFTDNASDFDHPINLYIHDNYLFMSQLGFLYRINPEKGTVKWKRKFSTFYVTLFHVWTYI